MTLERRPEGQRDLVNASLARDEQREHHDRPLPHPLLRAVEPGTPTVGSCAQSIRELAEMLQAADRHPMYHERLANVDVLAARIGMHLATLRGLVDAEYTDSMGAGA